MELKVTIQKKILILCILFWYFSFWQKARNVLVPPLQCIAFPFMRVLKGVECRVGATHPWDRPSVTRSKKKKSISVTESLILSENWEQAGLRLDAWCSALLRPNKWEAGASKAPRGRPCETKQSTSCSVLGTLQRVPRTEFLAAVFLCEWALLEAGRLDAHCRTAQHPDSDAEEINHLVTAHRRTEMEMRGWRRPHRPRLSTVIHDNVSRYIHTT